MAKKTKNPATEQKKKELASYVLQPELQSGITLADYAKEGWDDIDANALACELRDLIKPLKDNNIIRAEAMLMAQAMVLDVIFNKLARVALAGSYGGDFCFSTLDAALKVQRQGITTLDTLARLKKSMSVSIIEQQNNTQINHAPAPTETQKVTDKLLSLTDGSQNYEKVDFGGEKAASGADTQLEALAKINGTED